MRDLPIVVQDLDDSAASRELIDSFRGSLTFRIVPLATDRNPDSRPSDGDDEDDGDGYSE